MKISPQKPAVLIILDGFGYREATDHNAIAAANTPHWDRLWNAYPHTLLSATGHSVGLPSGQMGNSEVGHLHMGAGREVPQSLVRINQAIESGEFYKNEVLVNAIKHAQNTNTAIHLLGLLSPGGVHSHEEHIFAFAKLAHQMNFKKLYIHAILDGRDTPPQSAESSLVKLRDYLIEHECGHVASIMGRYYAMDRDNRWERTEKAFNLLTKGETEFHDTNTVEALHAAYARGETDEFVMPTAIHSDMENPIKLEENDQVVFMNFRADRARQLSELLLKSTEPELHKVISLTEYAKNLNTSVAYPPQHVTNSLGEWIAKQGLSQLRIAETEKYAHVTFFFNGGVEPPFENEDRILIASPKVPTYDLKPEMSAPELTAQLVEKIRGQQHDAIICNFANPDMVGHTGNFDATVKAIECIDNCIGQITKALDEVGGCCLITSDHGNAEQMHDPQNEQAHTAHTTNPVPLLYVGKDAVFSEQEGKLTDLAPTMLFLLGLEQPTDMTGKNLLKTA